MRRARAGFGMMAILAAAGVSGGADESGVQLRGTGFLVKALDAVLFVREPAAITGASMERIQVI